MSEATFVPIIVRTPGYQALQCTTVPYNHNRHIVELLDQIGIAIHRSQRVSDETVLEAYRRLHDAVTSQRPAA